MHRFMPAKVRCLASSVQTGFKSATSTTDSFILKRGRLVERRNLLLLSLEAPEAELSVVDLKLAFVERLH